MQITDLPTGLLGQGGRQGAETAVLDANIARRLDVRQRARLRLELVAANVLNHLNYVHPNTNITNLAQLGVISSVADRNTRMDMAIPRDFSCWRDWSGSRGD